MVPLIKRINSIIKLKLGSINVTRKLVGTNKNIVFLYPGTESIDSTYEGHNYIHNAVVSKSKLGAYTYVGPGTKIRNAKIGRFCSIASEVSIGLGIHPSRDFISMHPSFYSLKNTGIPISFVKKEKFIESTPIEIGNDVWIGHRAIILDGVKVGHGAAVGAGALVTKDIPPYAIVGGVPAEIIRYRFSKKQIDFLLKTEWWNKSEDWISRNAENFESYESFKQCQF